LIKADFRETGQGRIQFFENKYELNPAIFGEEYNWYKNNPTLRAYSKENVGSYSRKGISPSGVESSTTPSVGSDTRVVSEMVPGTGLKISELLEKARSKNPSSNNPNTNNPSLGDLNFSESSTKSKKKQRTQAEHEAIVREQVELLKAGRQI